MWHNSGLSCKCIPRFTSMFVARDGDGRGFIYIFPGLVSGRPAANRPPLDRRSTADPPPPPDRARRYNLKIQPSDQRYTCSWGETNVRTAFVRDVIVGGDGYPWLYPDEWQSVVTRFLATRRPVFLSDVARDDEGLLSVKPYVKLASLDFGLALPTPG
jgi:hypothetical protein